MVRTLRRDLAEYNSVEEKEELLEESGWKLVHADVLRTPPNVTLLATSVGTGMQLLGMTFISIACAALGFLSPANRGSMLTVTLLLFVLMGSVAGYSAAITYKAFKGHQWKALTLLTAFLFPGITFAIFFLLNFFMCVASSSADPTPYAGGGAAAGDGGGAGGGAGADAGAAGAHELAAARLAVRAVLGLVLVGSLPTGASC